MLKPKKIDQYRNCTINVGWNNTEMEIMESKVSNEYEKDRRSYSIQDQI